MSIDTYPSASARPVGSDALIEQITTGLEGLPEPIVRMVLDFTKYLRASYRLPPHPVGSPAAMLACWGKWQFEAEERAALDAYIQTMREMPDDRLSA